MFNTVYLGDNVGLVLRSRLIALISSNVLEGSKPWSINRMEEQDHYLVTRNDLQQLFRGFKSSFNPLRFSMKWSWIEGTCHTCANWTSTSTTCSSPLSKETVSNICNQINIHKYSWHLTLGTQQVSSFPLLLAVPPTVLLRALPWFIPTSLPSSLHPYVRIPSPLGRSLFQQVLRSRWLLYSFMNDTWPVSIL